MNLKLYGICFKLRGGPDILDYVQSGQPVPVEVMEQVMAQMGSITQEELEFAERLDNDWKKAFNEKVPLLMGIAPDGGYDITCTVPDELLNTVRTLQGLSNEKIAEEYAANYLKTVCGVETTIVSVDAEKADPVETQAVQAAGFDLDDLTAMPDAPAFEDVSEFGSFEEEIEEAAEMPEPVQEMPEPALEEPVEEIPEEDPVQEDEMPEDEYMDEEYMEDEPQEEPEEAESEDKAYSDAIVGIYTELVGNIREKKLDERLGLRIGQ